MGVVIQDTLKFPPLRIQRLPFPAQVVDDRIESEAVLVQDGHALIDFLPAGVHGH